MFKSLSLIFAVLFLQGALSQVIIEGDCPEVELVENFDYAKYYGVWFGYSKYPFAATNDLRCNYAKYSPLSGNDLTVSNGGLEKINNETFVTEWKAKLVSNAALAVVYDSNQDGSTPNYFILGTDYTSWAAAYDCKQLNSTHHAKNAWLLTRERIPFGEIEYAKEVFIKNHVTLSYFEINDQYRCPTSV